MNRKNFKSLAPILGSLMLVAAPALVNAQTAVMTLPAFPPGPIVEFGDVEVGNTGSQDLIIRNVSTTGQEFTLTGVFFVGDAGLYFSLVSSLPATPLLPDQEITVTFEFTPTEKITYYGVAEFEGTVLEPGSFMGAMSMPLIGALVDLTGNGITGGVLDPLALIDKIIEDFHAGVANGSITGVSPGHRKGKGMGMWRVAFNRLRTLGFMLNSARWLIAKGHYDWAAWVVESVYKHVDGWGRPADFAAGPGLESIRDDLLTLLDILP